jgi:hypothetical protein
MLKRISKREYVSQRALALSTIRKTRDFISETRSSESLRWLDVELRYWRDRLVLLRRYRFGK